MELPASFEGDYVLTSVYGSSTTQSLKSNINFEIQLKPFETKIYEVSKNEK